MTPLLTSLSSCRYYVVYTNTKVAVMCAFTLDYLASQGYFVSKRVRSPLQSMLCSNVCD